MSKYFLPLLISLVGFTFIDFYPAECDNPGANCTLVTSTTIDSCFFKGIHLKGKVKFVESFPDIKVKFVNSFPDLNVKFVSSFPDDCGEWQVVESFPDFKIQVVESFPDIEIKVVESFPGLP